jgi:acetylornithine deacetylase/succinyl-diaminopimelate desuccinylase-like protein
VTSDTGRAADSGIRDYVTEHADAFRRDLEAWLAIPSVSADPAHRGDVQASADWLAAACRAAGFPSVEVWPTDGQPAVFADWPADGDPPGAPTVLVYGHHDVQPVDPEAAWTTPPFAPTLRGDELFARGASDDKGQVLFHLLGLAAHLATTGRSAPAVHLKLLVEGEEEVGSPHFARLLADRRGRLDCDLVVVSDTGMYAGDVPSVCTGMRGLLYCQIDLRGPDVDLHSGSFGGAVPNPLAALAGLLAGLHDDGQRVTLPGFYDRVAPLGQRERELFARLPFDEAAWLATAASRATFGEAGYSTLERIWARPTCEINGIWGGYTGPGSKTIVPAEAHAKVSFRLVADQQPAEVAQALRDYVRSALPPGVEASVEFFGGGVKPCLTGLDEPALQAVRRALSRAFDGTEILITREGGSGPEAELAEALDAPLVYLGVGLPSDRIHAPDERVRFPLLLRGAEAAAYLWGELAAG